MNKEYIVYIEQVNQTYYIVTAQDEDSAEDAAKKLWRSEVRPRVSAVEEK